MPDELYNIYQCVWNPPVPQWAKHITLNEALKWEKKSGNFFKLKATEDPDDELFKGNRGESDAD
jgi:hypothetical protein